MADILVTKIPSLLKLGSQICSVPLRFYYTAAKLEKFLLFDIPSNGESLTYQVISQDASCYLSATNLSPFDFTIDRIKVTVVLDGGGNFSCNDHMPHIVKGCSRQSICLRGGFPTNELVAKHAREAKRANVTIEAHIITNIRSFQIRQYLNDIKNVRVI